MKVRIRVHTQASGQQLQIPIPYSLFALRSSSFAAGDPHQEQDA